MITRSLELLREMLRKDPAPSVREVGEEAVRMALEEEAQLRADLETAKSTAEALAQANTDVSRQLDAEKRRHAETRKALEVAAQQIADVARRSVDDLESTRAELAKAEARIQSASLLLDKCECQTLSTQIQLWQLETP